MLTSVWNEFSTPEPKVRLRASMMRTSRRPRAPPRRLAAPAEAVASCGACGWGAATDLGCLQWQRHIICMRLCE